jgi:hypothetical protein
MREEAEVRHESKVRQFHDQDSFHSRTPHTPPNEFLFQRIVAMRNVTIPQELWGHEVTASAPQLLD